MAEVNVQSFIITASGLLSAATGPNNTTLLKVPTASGGLTDQPAELKKIRVMGVKAIGGAAGDVQLFDSATSSPSPNDEFWGAAFNATNGGDDSMTNFGYNVKSGDVYVRISGPMKVYIWVDINS